MQLRSDLVLLPVYSLFTIRYSLAPSHGRRWRHVTWRALLATVVSATVLEVASARSITAQIFSSVAPRAGGSAAVVGVPVWPTARGCRRRPVAMDTVDVLVTATLESAPGLPRLPQGYALDLAQAAGLKLKLPAVVSVGVFAPDTVAVPVLAGAVSFTLDSSGTPRDVRLAGLSTTSVLDTALVAAIWRAAGAHRFPAIPPQLHQSSVDVTVSISSVQWMPAGDTVPARVPLFSIAMPRYRRMVRATDLRMPAALSIGSLTEAPALGESGPVLLQFIVDAHGLPEGETIRVVEADAAAARQRVERLFSHAVLTPAMLGHCAVPQLMRLPLELR